MRLSLDQLLSSIFSEQKGKIILFKNDEIYNNLSPKGKLAYLREIFKTGTKLILMNLTMLSNCMLNQRKCTIWLKHLFN